MQIRQKIHRSLFCLLLLFLPTQLGKHFWPSFSKIGAIRIDYLAPTIYLTDILLGLLLIVWLLKPILTALRKFRADPLLMLTVLLRQKAWIVPLLIYITANIAFARNPSVALLKWLKLAEMGLLAAYIIQAQPDRQTSSYCLLTAAALSAALAWLQFIKGGSIGGVLYWLGERSFSLATPGIARQSFFGREYLRPYATLPHPNVLAGLLTATLPLLLATAFFKAGKHRSRNKLSALLFTITVTIWLATIFISGSQIALAISWGIFLLFTVVCYKQLQPAALPLIFVGGSVFILAAIYSRYPLSAILTSPSFLRRLSLNIAAIKMFLSAPTIGVGLNNFIVRQPEFYRLNEPIFFLQPAHNIYLLTLAEGGGVGLLLFLWLLSKMCNLSLSHAAAKTNLPWLLAVASLLLIGFLDHYPLTLQQGLLLLTTLAALLVQKQQQKPSAA